MQDVLKSDIFFFVTTIVVAGLGIIFAIAMVYAIRILRDLNVLSQKAKDEGERILNDVRSLREDVRESGNRIGSILHFVGLLQKKSKKVAKKDETEV